MMRILVCICILTIVNLPVFAMSTPPPAEQSLKSPQQTDALTIFFTGNTLGVLKPCGCSGGQLGGLDRRSAILNSVSASARMIVDTGEFVETDSEQNLIKFNILVQALNLLDYDLVNLSEEDIERAKKLDLLGMLGSAFNVITSTESDAEIPQSFTKRFSLNKNLVAVTIAAYDGQSPPADIKKLFPQPGTELTVNILLLNECNDRIIDSVAKAGIIDCLVCPSQADEPMIIGDTQCRPLVVSVGRLGKYIGKLQIISDTESKLKFDFSEVPLTEDIPPAQSLTELYSSYQQLVKEADLLVKHPRFSLPDNLEYIGSKTCMLCHDYEYNKWSEKAHAHAYSTLEKVNSQYDPECIVCHVVGFDYESGFVSEDLSPDELKNVGCENCHGPGSRHIATLGKAKTAEPKADCIDCHTPENSAGYAGNELIYLEKITHWKEPNSTETVKIEKHSQN